MARQYVHQRRNVRQIRSMRRMGFSLHQLAQIFGGHYSNHSLISNRKTWRKG